MLNGDVLTDLDLRAQIARSRGGRRARHARARAGRGPERLRARAARGRSRRVAGFLEKPSPEEIDTNLISAGAYVLERSVLDLIDPGRNVSIEREVWPALVGEGLYGHAHDPAYWIDIGTPERYLQGIGGHPRRARAHRRCASVSTRTAWRAVRAASSTASCTGRRSSVTASRIAEGAVVGPHVVLGDRVRIEPGVDRRGCASCSTDARDRPRLDGHAARSSRPARRSARTARSTGGAVLGAGVVLGAGNVLDRGVRLFPGVALPDGAVAF